MMQSISEPDEISDRARDSTFWGLLAFALLIRVTAIVAFPSIHHPDENFQLFEPAHRLAFGSGIVPWEFQAGIRSPVLPFLYAGIFAVAEPIVGGPEGYLAVAKLVLALSSLAGVAAVYQMGKRTSPTHALIGGLVVATWFELVYFADRPLTEAVATTVLLIGLSLASVSDHELSQNRLLTIGLCLGLCLMLRIHLAVGLFVAAIFVGRLGLRTRWWPMALSGLIPVAVFGAADWITYGAPFHSYVEYVRINLIQGKASLWGEQSTGWYFHRLLLQWKYALPVLVILMLVRARASMIWLTVAMAIIVSLSFVPHKEYRFMFPAIACLVVAAAMGSSDLIETAKRALGPCRTSQYLVFVGALLWMTTSVALAFAKPFNFEWFKARGVIEASFAAAKKPNLCGLLFYGYAWWNTGGYAHLHRNVPIYAFEDESSSATGSTADFNAIILKRSFIPAFTARFRVQQCFSSLGDEDACLMVREGPCASDTELSRVPTF
jgi:GPI mannosyltransferase 3